MSESTSKFSSSTSRNYVLSSKKSFLVNDSDEDTYIVNCALNCASNKLAVNTTSNISNPIKIIDVQTSKEISSIKFSSQNINPKLKFSMENSYNLMLSTNRSVELYDVRHTNAKVSSQFFINPKSEFSKADQQCITCFDFNSDFTYIAAATELCSDQNVYIHFWDYRKQNQLITSYNETHKNDVNDIEFHPTQRSILASGGCDELVNIFDVIQSDEEEALLATLNIESSIARIRWSKCKNENNLFCMTQDELIQFWDYDEVKPSWQLNGKANDFDYDYVVDVIDYKDLICVGNNQGIVYVFDVDDVNCNFSLTDGHSKEVRTTCTNKECLTVFTGGEDGVVCTWNYDQSDGDNQTIKQKTKLKRKDEKHRAKPY